MQKTRIVLIAIIFVGMVVSVLISAAFFETVEMRKETMEVKYSRDMARQFNLLKADSYIGIAYVWRYYHEPNEEIVSKVKEQAELSDIHINNLLGLVAADKKAIYPGGDTDLKNIKDEILLAQTETYNCLSLFTEARARGDLESLDKIIDNCDLELTKIRIDESIADASIKQIEYSTNLNDDLLDSQKKIGIMMLLLAGIYAVLLVLIYFGLIRLKMKKWFIV